MQATGGEVSMASAAAAVSWSSNMSSTKTAGLNLLEGGSQRGSSRSSELDSLERGSSISSESAISLERGLWRALSVSSESSESDSLERGSWRASLMSM